MPQADTDDVDLDDARARGDFVDEVDADDVEEQEEKPAAKASKVDEAIDKADADEADEPDEKPEDKAKPRTQTIPKARFDEARRKDRERIKELERQLAAGQPARQAPPSPQQRITSLEEQAAKLMEDHTKALDDGDTKKAAALLTQIRQIDRDIVRIESATTSARDREIAVEQVRLDMLIDSLEDKYPQLREGSDEYDEDLVEEIGDLRTAFEARGLSSSDALKRAVKYVLRDEGTSTRQVNADVEKAAEKADKAADKAADVGRSRRAEAVRRNLETQRRQPADTHKAPGLDSHKAGGGIDLESVASMSDKDFDALPEATLKKLRGDYYAPSV